MFVFFVALLVVAFTYFIRNRRKKLQLFKNLGIPGPEPSLFFGNTLELVGGPSVAIEEWRKQYGNTFGFYEGTVPVLLTSDIDLIKQVFIKDFNKFVARKSFPFGPDPDESKTVSLVLARRHRWKRIRSILSPTFSTNKLKMATPLVTERVDTLLEILEEKRQEGKPFNILTSFQGLTLDVISSTIFGLHADTQRDQDSKFIHSCRQVFADQNYHNLSPARKCLFLCGTVFPTLGRMLFVIFRFLNMTGIISSGGFWLAFQVRKVIKERRSRKYTAEEKPKDILQAMLDVETVDDMIDDNSLSGLTMTQEETEPTVQNGTARPATPTGTRVTKIITADEVVSNAVVFLLAGYETTSTALSYAANELALHPEIQERLQDELDTELAGKAPDYQALFKLQYLDMVFNEVIRKNPVAPSFVTRQCLEDATIGDYSIPAGMAVQCDVYSVHRNPDLWGPQNPLVFDPERFSPENKATRNPASYLPFGIGPRNCIGMRFALLEAKMALTRILQKYKIERCPETETVITTTEQATVVPKHGVFVKLTLRNREE